MQHRIRIDILPQPDLTTCGPTCLHAVYRHFGDEQDLGEVIERTPKFAEGGTLAVMLAVDALKRGYAASIHTFNLNVFDPTWFHTPGVDLVERLARQRDAKPRDPRLQIATDAYIEFLGHGGRLTWGDLTPRLLRDQLRKGRPILTGLSATYLYQERREAQPGDVPDDILGLPVGHFVVLSGYDKSTRTVRIADPLETNPVADDQHYSVPTQRVVCAILLGVLTYDANFLIIEPNQKRAAQNKPSRKSRSKS